MQAFKLQKNRSACNWWKSPRSTGKPYTFVMFVPPTPNGELVKMLKKRERELNGESEMNIKFIEKGGIKVKNLLVKKDPFPAQKCGVSNCPFCNKANPLIIVNKKQKCTVHNVGYRFKCTECDFSYEGETHRRISVRAGEHSDQLRNKSEKSALWKHILKHHPIGGQVVKFELSVTGQFFDPLSRQADESQRIQNARGKLMNSKSEFKAPKIKRIVVRDLIP